jgi:hypothetical protein
VSMRRREPKPSPLPSIMRAVADSITGWLRG